MKWAAARTSILLSVLFVIVYSACNEFTAHRDDVGTWYYAWERHIPFVPIMILPYMSIDLFFIAAPFLCGDDRERRTFSRRVILAIAAAGACFLAFPLHLAVDRPEVGGWLGAIFNPFRSMDRPFNLCPSLHIALRTILAYTYARHTRGGLRVASHAWFSLVGLSTILTYQHHVVDVAGGFVLALFCFYLIREEETRAPASKGFGIGAIYATGCLATLALTAFAWPWGAVFLYPALSLGIVAAAYVGAGPCVFRKFDGRLPLSARLLLGPVLVGQRLSLLFYRRRSRPWDRVTPMVWIGRALSDAEASEAVRDGVAAVLDLTSEFSEARPFRAAVYRNLPVLDLTAPTMDQVREGVAFIVEQEKRGPVYVHCKVGYSRSAAVVGAYLMTGGQAAGVDDAAAKLRAARPSIVIRPEAMEALRAFGASLRADAKP